MKIYIYIVKGETGEYSDKCFWDALAFKSELRAITHRDFLNEKYEEFALNCPKKSVSKKLINYDDCEMIADAMKPFDPYCKVDYTGIKYFIESVELDEAE